MVKKILVVEDSPTQAQRAQLILQKEGYDVSWAFDGQEGLKQALSGSPDLVVTDIMMPNMDGYRMTSQLKSNPETKDIPVVMLTTKGEVSDIIKGLAAGADNFITKPYESSFLVNRIQTIFDNVLLRQTGKLTEDAEIEDFKGKIVMTSDRHQILELLLSTISVIIHCNVMGIFLLSEALEHSLYMVSLQPLSSGANSDLRDKLLAAASVLVDGELSSSKLRITSIVKDKELPVLSETFNSFISVPLIHNGKVIGILNTANIKQDAFQADDVKLLFMVGSESADALDLISR